MRFDCECSAPLPSSNPRKADTCNRCSGWVNPRWASTDANVMAFFDRLAEAAFPGAPPPDFETFRVQCRARERAGRDTYGFAYLSRANLTEAREEAADLALYPYLDLLQKRRGGDGEEDIDLVLTIAYHAFRAYEATLELYRKRHGAPDTRRDEWNNEANENAPARVTSSGA